MILAGVTPREAVQGMGENTQVPNNPTVHNGTPINTLGYVEQNSVTQEKKS